MYSKIRDQDIKMTDRTVLSSVKFSTNQTDWWLLNFFCKLGTNFFKGGGNVMSQPQSFC